MKGTAAMTTAMNRGLDSMTSASESINLGAASRLNWFENEKYESEVNGSVDWRETWNPTVLSCLKARVNTGSFVLAR